MEGRSAIQQRFIDGEITDALARNRLPHVGTIREVLDARAEIVGEVGKPYLRVRDDRGQLVWIDTYIEELKADPTFRAYFPDPPKIARDEDDLIRENFDKIVSGEMQVVR